MSEPNQRKAINERSVAEQKCLRVIKRATIAVEIQPEPINVDRVQRTNVNPA